MEKCFLCRDKHPPPPTYRYGDSRGHQMVFPFSATLWQLTRRARNPLPQVREHYTKERKTHPGEIFTQIIWLMTRDSRSFTLVHVHRTIFPTPTGKRKAWPPYTSSPLPVSWPCANASGSGGRRWPCCCPRKCTALGGFVCRDRSSPSTGKWNRKQKTSLKLFNKPVIFITPVRCTMIRSLILLQNNWSSKNFFLHTKAGASFQKSKTKKCQFFDHKTRRPSLLKTLQIIKIKKWTKRCHFFGLSQFYTVTSWVKIFGLFWGKTTIRPVRPRFLRQNPKLAESQVYFLRFFDIWKLRGTIRNLRLFKPQ